MVILSSRVSTATYSLSTSNNKCFLDKYHFYQEGMKMAHSEENKASVLLFIFLLIGHFSRDNTGSLFVEKI